MEELDITGLNSGNGFASNDSNELQFTSSMLDNWIGSNSGSFKLTLTAVQAEDISFTDFTTGTERNTTAGSGTDSIVSGTTYNLDADTQLIIDIQ